MSFLPEDVRRGLEEARVSMLRKSTRLCIHDGDEVYPISRIWDGGFSIHAATAPKLRGYVELFDGPRQVSTCLIVNDRAEAGEQIYEFKWNTRIADRAPVDFERSVDAPVALIGHD